MRKCCVCGKRNAGGGLFFSIPSDERRKLIWMEICQRVFKKNDFICGDHFLPSDIIKGSKRYMLLPRAMPLFEPMNTQGPSEDTSNSIETQECTNGQDMDISFGGHEFIEDDKLFKNMATQTEPFMFEYTTSNMLTCETKSLPIASLNELKNENSKSKAIIRKLETEIKELHIKLQEANKIISYTRSIFTDGQIRKIVSPGALKWKWPDISSAICLHASGPRAYMHLYRKGFPLPSVSTLQRWSQKINISEGILTAAIDFMRHNTELTSKEKICVLAFDEMKVVETFEYDAVGDFVRKPANYVQVVMARGLWKSWKQPVFFSYDCEMDKRTLFCIISQLSTGGYTVVGIVSDMGATNRKLWKTLDVSQDRPRFPHPVNPEDKIFAFADAPHLLKLIRNHFLDTGLICNNSHLKPQTIVDLLKLTSTSDVSITFKLSNEHISVTGPGRQKVKPAAQLFSNSTANAIRRCYAVGFELYNAIDTADFFQLVNDWFDVLNSKLKTFNYPGKQPFGLDLNNQKNVLMKMNQLMSVPMIPKKKSLEFFQKGVIMTNTALIMLHDYLQQKYGMEYILTYRLNQDILENFFGALRSKGGLNDHPSPKQFKYRIRKYILARNTESLESTGNVEADNTQWLCSSNNDTSNSTTFNVDLEEDDAEEDFEPLEEDLQNVNPDNFGILQDDAQWIV